MSQKSKVKSQKLLPKVILVDIIEPQVTPDESLARLNELERLLTTYGGFVVIRKIQKRQQPNYKTYIGTGKLEEIEQIAIENKVDYVVINNIVKPEQLYNLEAVFEKHQIKVWDKIDLILEIFAKHATTKEAKLQIELAQLRHLGPRIAKMGGELMRQGGGIGTRGQGETNIEVMKRHIRRRENAIKVQIKKIEVNQGNQRRHRRNQGFKTVAIVGYTNAGKSQLLSNLTKKEVKVKDELFATLDSRIGRLYLSENNEDCLISDTIGFIRDLPPELIDAFHSTLAETIDADLLIHVIDASDLDLDWKIDVVNEVINELGCHEKPMLYVFNKCDLVNDAAIEEIEKKYGNKKPIFVSALKKINFEELKKRVSISLIKKTLIPTL